ncbi:BREX-1 system adenine-specific DNA-methyltransferase PglX [Mycobacteriaceae bacterium Msp059]|nr:BREX-1 system adenine-specific DNA-methyltransferase PglX [Mycobacteriaceae bacterium Msp059]
MPTFRFEALLEAWCGPRVLSSTSKLRGMAGLFGKNRLRELAQQVATDDIADRVELVRTWQQDYHTGSLKKANETLREQQYNQDFFGTILGYRQPPTLPTTLTPKTKTVKGQFPDAVLHFQQSADAEIETVAAVVELKGAAISLDKPQQREGNFSPVQQAFKYKPQYRVCPFVIVSNFWEFRLYNDNQLDYEAWTLDDLVDPHDDYLKFKIFYTLLHVDNFTSASGPSKTEALLSDIRTEQEAIGKEFYKVYREARLELLRDIYRNNPSARSQFELGIEKAQKVIDRIVFTCFAEDRGLLPDNIIERVVAEADKSTFAGSLWSVFKGFFDAIDVGSQRLGIPLGYNGGLFAEDGVLNKLTISDDALRNIALLSKYNFVEDLSVNILGHIFEQSISDLEEIKSKVNEAKGIEGLDATEKKASKRKKDGVYYTPDYIVRYIVENTVGAYLSTHEERLKSENNLKEGILDKTYAARERKAYLQYQTILQKVRILDPACGSGAFLVYAFDYLRSENERVDTILGGSLSGTDEYIRDILRNNLFGVDLNEESVEITKLSLWLKTAQRGKKLTALDENIRCGNSLIQGAVAGAKSFNWQAQFPTVFADGGFDVVIGNPPYVRVHNLVRDEVDYYFSTYTTPSGKLDISILFFEKALQVLKDDGLMAFISSSQWMQTDYGQKLRALLATGLVSEIVDFGSLPVFEDADTYPAIFTISKNVKPTLSYSRIGSVTQLNSSSIRAATKTPVEYDKLSSAAWQFGDFNLIESLINRKIAYVPFKDVGRAYVGDISGRAETFVLPKNEAASKHLEPELLYPYAYRNNEVFRYTLVEPDGVVIYPYSRGPNGESVLIPEDVLSEKYPNIYAHLLADKKVLQERQDSRKFYATGPDWYRHLRQGSFNYIEPPKLIFKGIDKRAVVGYIGGNTAFNGTNCTGVIIENAEYSSDYIFGILNSKLCSHYLTAVCPPKLNNTFRYNTNNINQVPILEKSNAGVEGLVRQIVTTTAELNEQSERFKKLIMDEYNLSAWPQRLTQLWDLDFAGFVRAAKLKLSLTQKDELLTFWSGYHATCSDLASRLMETDDQIDALVYEIYGLTEQQIKIVEAGFN